MLTDILTIYTYSDTHSGSVPIYVVYTVQYTHIHCTIYTHIHCTMYTYTVYNVHIYTVQCTHIYTVQCTHIQCLYLEVCETNISDKISLQRREYIISGIISRWF